ncbi:alpha-ribazole-5'-phosphate phosphatase-like protein [Drechmeria coniospora]|uniref:Alpha-ribazole-5'-phosphate phosphatase-like protein n=1 Tax=Drechmeria coniospora TaxID=98403 RepID=A0A151GGN9_DRECN|nr:alpha-ribazole-5'-phosphate phosphatase-like protein [Drechmeria coniospora]KYK56270.1 alpha-ribazole-5'-phosphate phosphatase-like protein [Drechmeria coniospora]ODA80578.1 hypothetical protein RJ55_03537 [Drechmeria coniospora]
MRLFFIRHGESVDNVAGIVAGSRDSPLTSHGFLQARRLGPALARDVLVSHIFSSPLQRAVKTAEAVRDAQREQHGAVPHFVLVSDLQEKDFGSREGASFRSRSSAGTVDDAESTSVMMKRANCFLDDYLVPLLCVDADTDMACAVVSHGIFLGVLTRALLKRICPHHIALPPVSEPSDATTDASGHTRFFWSNTGFLELTVAGLDVADPSRLPLQLRIDRVDCTSHLESLHKTRGGIGSAVFDPHQRTMHSYFTSASDQMPGSRA